MSPSIKLDAKLAELKMADVRLLILGTLCHDGKIDCEKLGALAGMKKTSANTNYWRAKNRLSQILDGKEESPTQTTDSKPENSNTAAKKTPAGTKRGAAKDAPAKKADSAPKRRKAAPKAASKPADESAQPEESAQAEETNDNGLADTAHLTE
ncbi:unnamed protein product [Penicillium egyptiacum]|uniref:Uncharacterized protein n=1 Tax=Penicillium egyptiacum TaxID=1303716 RepID=A0A9W4KI61_9EURO|nr:unnamed protein product [Penicillium egyptiacum]